MKKLFDVYATPKEGEPARLVVVLEMDDMNAAREYATSVYEPKHGPCFVCATARESYPTNKQHLLRS
jgi:hypothetical protein